MHFIFVLLSWIIRRFILIRLIGLYIESMKTMWDAGSGLEVCRNIDIKTLEHGGINMRTWLMSTTS